MPGDEHTAGRTTEGPAPARKGGGLSHLVLHLHPRAVREETLPLVRTWGLGGAAVVLFLLLVFTGALLLFAYEPSTERAFASVRAMEDEATFGSLVRSVHHHAGNLLLVVAVLHLLRVFFTGAWLPPRRVNWLVGLALLVLVALGNFTGYLLPWDQLAYWAVTIGTGMLRYVPLGGEALVGLLRGGAEVGPATLSRFFVLHVALLPILLLGLLASHFWLVRKSGGVMAPAGGERPRLVPVRPDLTYREGVAALVVLALVLTIGAVVPAPLEAPANPGLSPNPAKAPWYFVGFQELLVHLHPAFAVFVVPLLGAAFLAGLPFLSFPEPPTGRWFHSTRGRKATWIAAGAAVVLASAGVVLGERLLRWDRLLPHAAPVLRGGVLPLLLWSLVVGAFLFALARSLALSRVEAAQALFVYLATTLVVLTVAGALFRGPSMRLVLPWGTP